MVTITIPGVPPSPNVLRRRYRHPHAYKKLRDGLQHDIFYSTPQKDRNELYTSTGKMWVQVTLYLPRLYDPDNLTGCLKPILDSLKNLAFINNDSPAMLELLPTLQFRRAKNPQTIIKLGAVD